MTNYEGQDTEYEHRPFRRPVKRLVDIGTLCVMRGQVLDGRNGARAIANFFETAQDQGWVINFGPTESGQIPGYDNVVGMTWMDSIHPSSGIRALSAWITSALNLSPDGDGR